MVAPDLNLVDLAMDLNLASLMVDDQIRRLFEVQGVPPICA